MTSSWQRAVLALAVAVHVVFVWSIVSQPLDGGTPPTTRRFLTARLSYDSANSPGPGGDFFAVYHAGVQLRRGLSPYDLDETPRATPYFFRFIYSYSALSEEILGRIVTLLPPHDAYRVWLVVIEACLWGWIAVIWQSRASSTARVLATITLLLNQPYLLELHMGQFTVVGVGLGLLGLTAFTQEKRNRGLALGALLLAAATVLKTFPVVVAPALLRRRRGWIVAGCAIGTLLAALAASGLMPQPRTNEFVHFVDASYGPAPGAASAVQAVLVAVIGGTGVWLPELFPGLPTVILAVSIAATALVVIWTRPAVRPAGALLMIAFFLGFDHVWEHHYSAAIVAGTALLLDRRASLTKERETGILLCLVLLGLPTPFVLLPRDVAQWTTGMWLGLSLAKALPLATLYFIGLRSFDFDQNSTGHADPSNPATYSATSPPTT